MGAVYSILGSGMQGTSVAYDLARFGNPHRIVMGDSDKAQAQRAAERVNKLVGSEICQPDHVNALDAEELGSFLSGMDIVVSCVPYWMHPRIAPVAVAAKTSMVDLGGNTDITLATLAAAAGAEAAGVSVVPDTGLAPGMVNNIATYLMESMDEATDVKLYCGGLPQDPKPPFNYKLVFNVEGLVTEYSGEATALRNGEIIHIPTLTELEEVDHPKLGKLEAFVTSGGTSTAPTSFKGRVRNYEYKTFRYPGHCHLMKIFKDFGYWDQAEIETRTGSAVPREVFHTLMGPRLVNDSKDLVAVRGWAKGVKGGQSVERIVDIVDYHDDATGFTAMERMTGFSTSIYAIEIAQGRVKPGAIPYELAVTGTRYMEELRKRGFDIQER